MPTRWIVEPLIAEGHQVILAGEPKAGKSLLASQLCLEIAKGPGQLLQISLPGVASAIRPGEKLPPGAFRVATRNGATLKPGKVTGEAASGQKWKVLYVSFEMSPQVMWARTSQQATGMKAALLLGKPKPNPIPAPALDAMPPANYVPGTFPSAHGFFHLFDLMGEKDLGLIPKYKASEMPADLITDGEWLQGKLGVILEAIQPDLVIFDSLSKLHWCDENSNADMRDVLQSLRKLCSVPLGPKPEQGDDNRTKRPIAHIIIHHTRKDSGDQKFMRKGASEMRGASAIHAEADLAITITKRKENGQEISLNFSSRHSATLPDIRLIRHALHGSYTGLVPPEPTTLVVARRLFGIMKGRRHLQVDEIMAYYQKEKGHKKYPEPDLEKSSWEKMLNRLNGARGLTKIKGTRGKPTTFCLRSAVTEKNWLGLIAISEGTGKAISRKVGKSP